MVDRRLKETAEQVAGLSANEARLYSMLVKSGGMKATEIAKLSGMQRRTVYDVLQQLERKGLAGKVEVRGVSSFLASPPASLLSFLEEKQAAVQKLLPSLSRQFEAGEGVGATILYGKAGLRTVLQDIIALKSDFCVYYGQLAIADAIPKSFQIFNEKRKRLGIRARWVLLDVPEARKRAESVPMTEFRFIDPSAISGGVWWTYADRLVLFAVSQEPEKTVTILIKNADLARTFQKTFDDMFETNAQTYHGLAGMKAILDKTLECRECMFIGGTGAVPRKLPEYWKKEYVPEMLRRGNVWRNIAYPVILSVKNAIVPFHQIRMLPANWPYNPNVIWIYGDCVATILWEPKPVAFVVEDRQVASAYKKYFELLWKMSKPARK